MAGWKKVIVSGSHAELAQVSASGLKTPQNTTTTTGLAVLVDGGSGVIHKIDQSLIQGTNTEYAAGTGFNLNTVTQNLNAFTLNLDQIDHDLLFNFSSSEHIDWTTGQTENIEASNYQNTLYTGSDGSSGLHITESGGEWITLPIQEWTGVGALGSNDSGGSINWSGNIGNTGLIASLLSDGNAGILATNINATQSITVTTTTVGMSASVSQIGSSSTPAQVEFGSGPLTGGLFVSGTFIYNDLTFQEQVLQQYSGSHIFGGSATDTIQDFTGNIYISTGATSSIGFYGTGSGLTNIPSSAVNYQALAFSDGVTGSFATQNFGFDTATTLSAQVSGSGAGGIWTSAAGLYVGANAATTDRISGSAVTTAKILDANIQSGSLTSSIINDHDLSPYSGPLSFAPGTDYLLLSTGSGDSATLGNTKISAMSNFFEDQFPDNIDNDGNVTTISVDPDSTGTPISNLFLTVTPDVTTTPELGLSSVGGNGLQITNTNFVTGSGGHVLTIANGGTGASTAHEAAQNILGWEATDALGNDVVNSLTIGDSSDTITISGSLQVTAGATTNINLENFEVEDKIMQIGVGATSPLNDVGIKFGSGPTQSNALFYNGINANIGRLAYGYDLNPDNTIGLSTNHFPMTVFEGNETNAEIVKADQSGMMRVQSNEIYLYM